MPMVTRTVRMISLLAAAAVSAAALADPPAHGWRKKHDPYYVGYTGTKWDHDYDISSGRCNREAIATVVGGVVGGAIASRVAEAHPEVATLVGVIAGAVIGNRIGRELDEADRGCVGHALEIGTLGQRVTWTNAATGIRYELSPGAERKRDGIACREFTLVTADSRDKATGQGLACPSAPGVWKIVD